jgi:transposase-like protein
MSDNPTDFRAAVRDAMGDMPVARLAREAGVHQPSLNDWLSERTDGVHSTTLAKLFDSLGLSVVRNKPRKNYRESA